MDFFINLLFRVRQSKIIKPQKILTSKGGVWLLNDHHGRERRKYKRVPRNDSFCQGGSGYNGFYGHGQVNAFNAVTHTTAP